MLKHTICLWCNLEVCNTYQRFLFRLLLLIFRINSRFCNIISYWYILFVIIRLKSKTFKSPYTTNNVNNNTSENKFLWKTLKQNSYQTYVLILIRYNSSLRTRGYIVLITNPSIIYKDGTYNTFRLQHPYYRENYSVAKFVCWPT